MKEIAIPRSWGPTLDWGLTICLKRAKKKILTVFYTKARFKGDL